MLGDTTLLATAWATGLLGSTHCVGMCGGISAALTFALPPGSRRGARMWGYQLAYNSGRLLSYTVFGVIIGTLGNTVLAPWAGVVWPRLFAGSFMVVLGLYLAGWWQGLQRLEKIGGSLWRGLDPLRRKVLPLDHPLKAIVAGGVWGLLPCGLVYSALTLALARADSLMSGAVMLAFGFGTLPVLLLTGSVAGQLRQFLQRRKIRQLAGVWVILFGLWTALSPLQGHSHHHPNTPAPQNAMPSTQHHPH